MNCRSAELMIDKYLKNKLNAREIALFEDHLAVCKGCSSSLGITEALLKEQGEQLSVKAPEGFTESVMSGIHSLKAAHPVASKQTGWSTAYRRLGFSLVITAGIVMFTLLIPSFGGYPGAISTPAPQDDNTSGYIDVFTGFDTGVKGIFKTINKSIIDFKGGTDNEMQEPYRG